MTPRDILLGALRNRLTPEASEWLQDQCQRISSGALDKAFFLAFSQAVRHGGKSPLGAEAREQAEAAALHPDWDLSDWTRDQAARAALLLSLPAGPRTVSAVLALHQSADLGEHVALAKALFLLPDAKALIHVAREAIRSNMRDVFAAISQRNPYPAEHCDEIAWNQMVVKCLFVDLPLAPIVGLERRNNPELSRILVELARERRAAGRTLSPEALRCLDREKTPPEIWKMLEGESEHHA